MVFLYTSTVVIKKQYGNEWYTDGTCRYVERIARGNFSKLAKTKMFGFETTQRQWRIIIYTRPNRALIKTSEFVCQ